jgi:hypothetical protein
LPSACSTQARCVSTQRNAAPSGARGGSVRRTAPSRLSIASRNRLAAAERFTVSGRVRSPARKTRLELTIDDVEFEFAGFLLRNGPPARRNASLVHRLATAADQVMPFI